MKNNNRRNKNGKSLDKGFEKEKLQKIQGGIGLGGGEVATEISNIDKHETLMAYGGPNFRIHEVPDDVEFTTQFDSNTFNFNNKKDK